MLSASGAAALLARWALRRLYGETPGPGAAGAVPPRSVRAAGPPPSSAAVLDSALGRLLPCERGVAGSGSDERRGAARGEGDGGGGRSQLRALAGYVRGGRAGRKAGAARSEEGAGAGAAGGRPRSELSTSPWDRALAPAPVPGEGGQKSYGWVRSETKCEPLSSFSPTRCGL